jgi:hypothetical protein
MQRSIILLVAGVLCAVAFDATPARANVLTLSPSKDNTIFESNTSNSLGAGQAIFSGTNGQAFIRRGLIAFDVANSIPAGSTINSAQLTLFLNNSPSGGPTNPTLRLYRLSNDWGEGIAGNSSTGVNGIGQGFAAGDGDATWNARRFSTTTPTLWNSPGGDFSSIDSASLSIVGTTLNTPYSWQSTPALVADVQGWLDAPATNFGWLLKNDVELNPFSVRGFWTREAARTNQSAFIPQLQITFTPIPEPTATVLLLGTLLLPLRRRPR